MKASSIIHFQRESTLFPTLDETETFQLKIEAEAQTEQYHLK
jgi:hypothetical protein